MACRVGITMDPERRMSEWRLSHPNLFNWRILQTHSTKSAAQAAENEFASQYGCIAHPGGDGPEYAIWYVYYFQY